MQNTPSKKLTLTSFVDIITKRDQIVQTVNQCGQGIQVNQSFDIGNRDGYNCDVMFSGPAILNKFVNQLEMVARATVKPMTDAEKLTKIGAICGFKSTSGVSLEFILNNLSMFNLSVSAQEEIKQIINPTPQTFNNHASKAYDIASSTVHVCRPKNLKHETVEKLGNIELKINSFETEPVYQVLWCPKTDTYEVSILCLYHILNGQKTCISGQKRAEPEKSTTKDPSPVNVTKKVVTSDEVHQSIYDHIVKQIPTTQQSCPVKSTCPFMSSPVVKSPCPVVKTAPTVAPTVVPTPAKPIQTRTVQQTVQPATQTKTVSNSVPVPVSPPAQAPASEVVSDETMKLIASLFNLYDTISPPPAKSPVQSPVQNSTQSPTQNPVQPAKSTQNDYALDMLTSILGSFAVEANTKPVSNPQTAPVTQNKPATQSKPVTSSAPATQSASTTQSAAQNEAMATLLQMCGLNLPAQNLSSVSPIYGFQTSTSPSMVSSSTRAPANTSNVQTPSVQTSSAPILGAATSLLTQCDSLKPFFQVLGIDPSTLSAQDLTNLLKVYGLSQ